MPLMNTLKSTLEVMGNFCFPKTCVICESTYLDSPYSNLCAGCFDNIKPVKNSACTVCGIPFSSGIVFPHKCGACTKKKPPYKMCRSAGIYEGTLLELIKKYKYSAHKALFKPLADFMYQNSRGFIDAIKADLIVPVPCHIKRLRKRGFHSTYLLAKRISEKILIPVDEKNLIKSKNTKLQVELSYKERVLNLENSFSIKHKGIFKNKNILLVDDVYTSGSTIKECSKILRRQGKASNVYCLTLARSILD